MKKQIACPVCEGSGYVAWINRTEDTCSAGSKTCPHCDGAGTRMVDMTNADRIRDMSDEELAIYIASRTQYQPSPGSRKSYGGAYGNSYLEFHEAALDWLYWLQQPVKEGYDG